MMWPGGQQKSRDEALLSALAKRLRGMAASVQPSEDFRSSLRSSLMRDAQTELVPGRGQPTPQPPRAVVPRRRTAMAFITAFVAISLGLGGVASASTSALPGEALYPVKRATEQVQLTFHRDLADRGAFQLQLAERRLDEAAQLSARGPEFDELATQAVGDFEAAAAAGTADLMAAFIQENERDSIAVLNRFTERTDGLLSAMESQLPGEGTAAVGDAKDRLEAIERRSVQLCPSCADDSGDADTAGPGDSANLPPEPDPEPQIEPEPEPEPQVEPEVEPEPEFPAPSDDNSEEATEDDNDDEGGEQEQDEQRSSVEPIAPAPTVTPEPVPTEPVPAPTEPAPTEPAPTEPVPTEPVPAPSLLDIVPQTLEGVTTGLGGLLGQAVSGLL